MKYSNARLASGLALLLAASDAAALNLTEVEQLIKSGRAASAYEQLAPLEFKRAGEADFDYLLGVAALEAGHPARATLAFERVLAVDALHAAARLDIGRAYFALGDFERARSEFIAARRLDPPQAAVATIDRYLAALDERGRKKTAMRASGYVEAGFGRDSNITVGPRQSTIYLPTFGVNFTLDPLSRELRDDYRQLGIGGELTHALSERLTAYAGADIKARDYRRYDSYDYATADWRAGLQMTAGPDVYRLNAGYNDYRLENDAYRRTHMLGADWRRGLDERNAVLGFAQYSRLRYVSDGLNSNDVNQWVLGAGWSWQAPGSDGTALLLSGYFGQELEVNERIDGNKDLAGVRFGAQKALAADLDVYSALSAQSGRYSRENSLLQQTRRDTQYDVTLGAVWRFAADWSLRPQAAWTRNDSSLSINDYKRYDLGVFVRRDFR